MPVKYEFYDMAGEVVGSNSATDDFAVRNCTPGADNPRLESVYVNFSTGNDNKNQNDNYVMFLYPGAMNKTVSGSDVTMTNSLMTYLEDGALSLISDRDITRPLPEQFANAGPDVWHQQTGYADRFSWRFAATHTWSPKIPTPG